MKTLLRPGIAFAAIGLALYALLYFAAEQLLWRTAHSNPLYKVAATREASVDWVVLGASHAMTMDFDDFNAMMQDETGLRIVQLAGPGTGPLYNRFVLEHFLSRHRAQRLLYVADSFAFYSRQWNEDRFADAGLIRRTPFDPVLAARLGRYVRTEGVDASAWLDYLSGFSKINNRERFVRDAWEGEAQFDRVARASASASKKRLGYLYPDRTPPEALARYLGAFSSLLALARQHGMQVTVVKMPLPAAFRKALPDEAAFDEALGRVLASHGARYADYSEAIPDARMYFDTDHLNREGLRRFFSDSLKPLLLAQPDATLVRTP